MRNELATETIDIWFMRRMESSHESAIPEKLKVHSVMSLFV
jgi:hypothetical protein